MILETRIKSLKMRKLCIQAKSCVNQVVKQITRRYSSKDASSSSSKDASSSTFKQNHFFNFIEANVISVFIVAIVGAHYFGGQHVYHTVELKSIKESLIEKEKLTTVELKSVKEPLIEKEKVAIVELKSVKESLIEKEKVAVEKEKALEKVWAEKEKALEKVLFEKEKAIEKVLFEKEKTQAAEKRELEARIRELETRIKFEHPPAS